MKKLIFPFILCVFFSSCGEDDKPHSENPPVDLVKIEGFNGSRFVKSDGELFFPWGYNYTNPEEIGLIEDNWNNESTWEIIEGDLEEMSDYAANTVRIHLQYNKFMDDPNTPNEDALLKLRRLIELGEDKGLYFIVTGLAAYRLDDAPAWYDALDDAGRWESQGIFWRNVAKTLKNQNAVFAYDLINEPTVANGCEPNMADCSWYPSFGNFEEFHFVQNISLNPDNTYWETISEWSDLMTEEIRKEDSQTLITIGLLPLGPIHSIASHYDMVTTHIYPKSGELSKLSDYIADNQSDKPLVISEFFNLHCSADELKDYIEQTEGQFDGIIGHYFGKRLEDHSLFSVNDQIRKNFIEFMIENNPN